ncbi:amino acid ABC transporter substrate-binding protein (PAAT family) [Nitrospirillum amazonense]|uniref:Amino acid ABC transporter substrate-binding protein (PAAT family) n=1 Tax=Nitrospirillum amazonense TaxID=28077 RepID=A0A560FIC6_9PROT|nr:transporter substrate-binding domain-containing protein [Nitrospirillum amazonense]TWB21357.1 amino acid ABC transporter substrate-binding protein (PAAT family) [Nitrospirillum amazonense]
MLRQLLPMLAAFLLVTPAWAGELEDIRQRGVLRVGVSLGGEPVGFRDDRNAPAGYDVDVAKRLADKLGVRVEYTDVSGDARVSMLVSGQIDVAVANLTATAERAKTIAFTIPYNRAGLRVIVQKSAGIDQLSDLAGKRVVVGRSTTGEAFLRQAVPGAKLVHTDTFAPDGVLLLVQRRVDAGIEDSSMMDYLASVYPSLKILPDLYSNAPIAIGLAQGDPEFLRWLNGFVADYIRSGAYEANYRKWWGRDAAVPALSAD